MALTTRHGLVAVIAVALIGGGAWYWQNKSPSARGPAVATAAPSAPAGARTGGPAGPGGPVPVEVGKVVETPITDDASAVGSLRSRRGVMLRPEVSGRIAQIGFADGHRVKAGQLLVQLDDTLQKAQLQQAIAQANIARTNLQRSRELVAQGFISQSAVDQNAANLEVAEAQVSLARAQLARMQMLAPFDATAGIKLVNVGDYLKDGADIVNLEDMSAMSVDFRLPERYLARVRPGLVVEVTLDALPGRTFAGRVEAADSQVDANGRALLVRARVDNGDALLKPGMFARPRIVFAQRDHALVVPEEALVPQGTRQFIYKVVDDGKGGKMARRVEAKLGLRMPGKVEILEGLAAGDLVVTAGQARLARGDNVPVRPIDLASVAAPRPAGPAASAAKPGAAPASGGRRGPPQA